MNYVPKIAGVDLFCGAGGLTRGLIKSGIEVYAGYDTDPACCYPYEYNNDVEFRQRDIREVTGRSLSKSYPKGSIRLLAGCAPCQPFSTYSRGRDASKDSKWSLLHEFARLIREVRPELVTMENVPDVVKHSVYDDFVTELKNAGYHVWANPIYCPDYGLPQMRTRHVLLASKLGPISFIKPTYKPKDYKTVKKVIGKLPPIAAGEQHPSDPLHKAASLSKLNLRRIRRSKPGGSWLDWPEDLRADCHRKISGKTYTGVYARMRWDNPSPTMTTQCYGYGNGRFGHPHQNRAISLREAALLQTFPKNYRFAEDDDKLTFTSIGRMIGNAVPVQLGKVIGRSLMRHVEKVSVD